MENTKRMIKENSLNKPFTFYKEDDIPSEIFELIGAIIGDGNIYVGKKITYIEISLSPKEDKKYAIYLSEILKRSISYSPKIYVHSGALRLRIYKKDFVKWILSLGIPHGKEKFKKVTIPKIAVKRNDWLKLCIRGIFDTDGSVFFDRRSIYRKPYIRIEFHMENRKLLNQIKRSLEVFNINSTIPKKKLTLYINGYKNVEKFVKIIGSSNPKHKRKLKTVLD